MWVSNMEFLCMNPRLVKFAVDLQNAEKVEERKETFEFSKNVKFFNFFKTAKVTVVVNPID